jgi:hypothetical protein
VLKTGSGEMARQPRYQRLYILQGALVRAHHDAAHTTGQQDVCMLLIVVEAVEAVGVFFPEALECVTC